jgi:prepilin-type N-terminal cleavage/methylation domain-containing protein
MKLLKKRKSSGFTLIELLIVVLILAILVGIFLSNYTRVVEQGRSSEATSFVGQLKESVGRYMVFNSQLPTALNQLDMDLLDTGLVHPANYFSIELIPAAPGFSIVATRGTGSLRGANSNKYGNYLITFDSNLNTITCTTTDGTASCTEVTSYVDTAAP